MRVFVTGIGGLVGSAVAELAKSRGYEVAGVDSNHRGKWFGSAGDIALRMLSLRKQGIRVIRNDYRYELPAVRLADLIVHCAAQPSHDFSRNHVLIDSTINYRGTLDLLEYVRVYVPTARVVFLSTNKVYGDLVNRWSYRTIGRRFVPDDEYVSKFGIDETLSIDDSLHTPFGASKLAADILVQEYRHTFGLDTTVLRCGCLTGTGGAAVELHGFLGHLVACVVRKQPYTVYGHAGFQVRDNLDATDLADAILQATPGVYNMGGGPSHSISVCEALDYLRYTHRLETDVDWNGPARLGDHKWWITDTRRFEEAHPSWHRAKTLYQTLDEMVEAEKARLK